MHLEPGYVSQMVKGTMETGSFIPCHDTLEYGPHPEVGRAVCRGWWDAYQGRSYWVKVMLALFGKFHEVKPPSEEER